MATAVEKNVQVNLNIDELKDLMTHVITNNRVLQAAGKIPNAVGITGESGIGKTSMALQLKEELKLGNIAKVNLAQIEDLGD